MMKNYRKKQLQPMMPWNEWIDMRGVSVSEADLLNDSPCEGDMIAINPNDPTDRWLVAQKFFEENYEPVDGNATLEQQLADMTRQRDELAAGCNRLRTHLIEMGSSKWWIDKANRLINETPPASLAAHDEEVIAKYEREKNDNA